MGSRAIFHDGWKATTDHVADYGVERQHLTGSSDFRADRWSLFDLDTDFSEARDLADKHPVRLREMTELWWHEAGRNQVLPLMDDRADRTTAIDPPAYRVASEFVLTQDDIAAGAVHLPASFPAGFRLDIRLTVPEGIPAAGVITCYTNDVGGWACYVLDGHMHFTFHFGQSPTRLVSRSTIQPGTHDVRITSALSAADDATSVTINGARVCTGPGITATNMLPGPLRPGTLMVGRGQGLPVCSDYQPPFPFTGHIDGLTLTILARPTTITRKTIEAILDEE